jgi:hypothetical protein
MNLGIDGSSVERVSFDYSITLLMDPRAEISLSTTFVLTTSSGDTQSVDPEHAESAASAVLAQLHQTIVSHTVDETTGQLSLHLSNGAQIDIATNSTYEAWTFAGPKGYKVVARPGGGVTAWTPVD